jgi:glycosyltransferase involved in cell wall biosynthesis
MLKVHYISPSIFPSKAANSVHVIHQVCALSKLNLIVYLYGAKNIKGSNRKLISRLEKEYGVSLKNINFKLMPLFFMKAINLQIAIFSIFSLTFLSFFKMHKIYSRNLYAAFFFNSILRREIVFETHQIESGINAILQKNILASNKVKVVLITKKLHEILEEHFNIKINNNFILSDAAPEGIIPLELSQKRRALDEYNIKTTNYKYVCGYFGHLYEGRGIEVIISMAKKSPAVLYLIFGGNDEDIFRLQGQIKNKNIKIMGHVDNVVARKIMSSVDCLLMPYQKKVSIGQKGHDTGRWMSPMKMFEYMASSNPIISSDLPVLREVLKNNINALLVGCDNIDQWLVALDRLIKDKCLSDSLSANAFKEYDETYNWLFRAKRIEKILRK